jgi:hypothetical protein
MQKLVFSNEKQERRISLVTLLGAPGPAAGLLRFS